MFKIGDRVCWCKNPKDLGTIVELEDLRGNIRVKWDKDPESMAWLSTKYIVKVHDPNDILKEMIKEDV